MKIKIQKKKLFFGLNKTLLVQQRNRNDVGARRETQKKKKYNKIK